jgi:gliding motility-associated lipoprotein GldH
MPQKQKGHKEFNFNNFIGSRHFFIFIFLANILLYSCDPHCVFEKNTRIPDGIWDKNIPVRFEVIVQDTMNLYNLYINVRNTGMYPMSNLYLFITTTAPSGHSVKDTIQIFLADEKGKWLGKGLGDILDMQKLYKKNIRFAQKGMYIFEYEHGMRIKKLPFILDVGLRVEKSR